MPYSPLEILSYQYFILDMVDLSVASIYVASKRNEFYLNLYFLWLQELSNKS